MALRRLLLIIAGLAAPLAAAPITFFTNLNGASESPATGSPGTGLAIVTIDSVAHTLEVSVSFQGLLTGNTASHIHVINGPGDANTADTLGPVATTTPTFTGFPGGVTSGSYQHLFDTTLSSSFNPTWVTANGGSVAAAEQALFAAIAEGRAYLNIHSTTFPGGEIRGFLVPIPEPGSFGFVTSALAGLTLLSRRSSR
jgi:hypothetical protein